VSYSAASSVHCAVPQPHLSPQKSYLYFLSPLTTSGDVISGRMWRWLWCGVACTMVIGWWSNLVGFTGPWLCHSGVQLNDFWLFDLYTVVIHLTSSNCMPILLYGLEACALNKSDISSLDFVLNRFFIKLSKNNNLQIITTCREKFGLDYPVN